MPTANRTLWPAFFIGLYASGFALAGGVAERAMLAVPPVLLQFTWWLLRSADRWLIVLLTALLILPPLPIRMGNSGPHAGIAIAAIGLLIGMIRASEWRRAVVAGEVFLYGYLAALILSLAPALMMHPRELVLSSGARIALFAISLYVFTYSVHGPFDGNRPAIRILFYAGVVSAAFACFDFVFQLPPPAGFGPQFVWLPSGVYRRAQGVFYEASTLGNLCVFFLLFIALSLLHKRGEWSISRMWLLLGAALFFAALVLSFSRASLVNLGLALTVLAYLHRARLKITRLISVGLGALVIGAAATYAIVPQVVEFYVWRLTGSLELLAAGDAAVLSGRVDTWSFLAHVFSENPVQALIGVGYKTLPYSDVVGRAIVADNAYLSALLETGILGLVAMVLFNFAILRIAFKSRSFYGQWIGCFWIGQMIQMLSGDLLTYWRVLPVYFWVLGLAARDEHSVS